MKKAEVKPPTFNNDSDKGTKIKEITFKISLFVYVIISLYLIIFK